MATDLERFLTETSDKDRKEIPIVEQRLMLVLAASSGLMDSVAENSTQNGKIEPQINVFNLLKQAKSRKSHDFFQYLQNLLIERAKKFSSVFVLGRLPSFTDHFSKHAQALQTFIGKLLSMLGEDEEHESVDKAIRKLEEIIENMSSVDLNALKTDVQEALGLVESNTKSATHASKANGGSGPSLAKRIREDPRNLEKLIPGYRNPIAGGKTSTVTNSTATRPVSPAKQQPTAVKPGKACPLSRKPAQEKENMEIDRPAPPVRKVQLSLKALEKYIIDSSENFSIPTEDLQDIINEVERKMTDTAIIPSSSEMRIRVALSYVGLKKIGSREKQGKRRKGVHFYQEMCRNTEVTKKPGSVTYDCVACKHKSLLPTATCIEGLVKHFEDHHCSTVYCLVPREEEPCFEQFTSLNEVLQHIFSYHIFPLFHDVVNRDGSSEEEDEEDDVDEEEPEDSEFIVSSDGMDTTETDSCLNHDEEDE